MQANGKISVFCLGKTFIPRPSPPHTDVLAPSNQADAGYAVAVPGRDRVRGGVAGERGDAHGPARVHAAHRRAVRAVRAQQGRSFEEFANLYDLLHGSKEQLAFRPVNFNAVRAVRAWEDSSQQR